MVAKAFGAAIAALCLTACIEQHEDFDWASPWEEERSEPKSDVKDTNEPRTDANRNPNPQLKGEVLDFMTKDAVPETMIALLDDGSGMPLGDMISVTTDEYGRFDFSGAPILPEVVAAVISRDGYKMTFHFDLDTRSGEFVSLWVVSTAAFDAAAAMAGIEVQPGMGVVMGQVLAVDEEHGEEPVGCGTVSAATDAKYSVFYFGENGMPASQEQQPVLSYHNGYFMIANLPMTIGGDKVELDLLDSNDEVRASTATHVMEGAVTFADIWIERSRWLDSEGFNDCYEL
jgi:hypothetical protein